MSIAIPENLAERVPCDLALVIALTFACILFVLAPRLNETPVRVVLGLLLVLFLPGYSLVAALFPRSADLDGVERVALSFGLSIAIVPLIGLGLNYTQYGIRLVPVLLGLSVFTILLALAACVRREMVSEAERFVVGGWGLWLGCGGDGSGGGRCRSGSGGEGSEGRGGGLA
ncbi:MAG: hypothetical protein C4B59_16880 [Candidatus Methanogaster sp.]|uniref:Uncharacterized protein n=1 Tax=Candidatus Methanogaster sp. TaxID=3386292 RepID=A0AC61KY55_9EURY|nr:MAG: hypothetical protein C4B59_16880 [ANME-2 cluster archaeon]